jgi:GT2 family glycosyltransferase
MTSSPLPSPPPPRVGGNRWDQLDVPGLGEWTPTRPVTVVIPYYQALDELQLTLAALSRQTYPHELLQVVVADDGSDPPLELPEDLDLGDLRVEVIHQEDLGFGAGRARNNGARKADGEILLFLDCDMVPEPWQVEAHARWHHAASDVVVMGFRRHVEFDGVTPDRLREVDADAGLGPLFDGRSVKVPEWIDGHMIRTADLTSAHDDLFRPVASGNLSMRADTYWRVGGFDESFTQWGAEDTELGYRLLVDGNLLVPDRDARCWHQGHGHEPTDAEKASLEDQRAKVAHLIAHRGFRSTRPGRSFTVPRVAVHVTVAAGTARESVVDTVESVLGGSFTDVLVAVEIDPSHPDLVWLQRQFEPDAKVRVLDRVDLDDLAPHTPVQVHLDAGIVLGRDTVAALVAALESVDDPLGLVHVTVPGRTTDEPDGMVLAWLTRAHRRAARAAGPDEEVVRLTGELFGERWMAGSDLGIHDRTVDAPPARAAAPVSEAANLDEVAEIWQVFRTLDPSERQAILSSAKVGLSVLGPSQRQLLMKVAKRFMLLAVALKALFGARSAGAALRGISKVLEALLPWAVYRPLRDTAGSVVRRARSS